MTNRKLHLQIDELVLDSLPFDQRQRVATAIETELSLLLADSAGGAEAMSGDRELASHQVLVNPQWSPERIGRHVAQSTHQQLIDSGTAQNSTNSSHDEMT